MQWDSSSISTTNRAVSFASWRVYTGFLRFTLPSASPAWISPGPKAPQIRQRDSIYEENNRRHCRFFRNGFSAVWAEGRGQAFSRPQDYDRPSHLIQAE